MIVLVQEGVSLSAVSRQEQGKSSLVWHRLLS